MPFRVGASIPLELASAARAARTAFGAQAGPQLAQTLQVVTQTAIALGVSIGAGAQALLDAHSVSIGDGDIALHSEAGIPLRSLGTGSSRLLVAGLQRAAAAAATVALVDEVEYGLEPHRLMRLLDSLGAKDVAQPLQVFMTTHSPVTLRELADTQLFVVRQRAGIHTVTSAGSEGGIQGTLRKFPEAFLSKSVFVCEGASEVGFARGMDQWWAQDGGTSFLAHGGSYVDAGGGTPDQCFTRWEAFLKLGYRVLEPCTFLTDRTEPLLPIPDAIFPTLKTLAVHLFQSTAKLKGVERACGECIDDHYARFRHGNAPGNGNVCCVCGTEYLAQVRADENDNEQWRGPYDHLRTGFVELQFATNVA